MKKIFTVGYSNRRLIDFIEILKLNHIDVVCDVRSYPYSQFNPHYNKEELKQTLKDNGIMYAFLGMELGGRPKDSHCFKDQKVRYELVPELDIFQKGIKRLNDALDQGYRPALMCAEKDPINCHRAILVTKTLRTYSLDIAHIIDKTKNETNQEMENRLLETLNIHPDLFDGSGLESLISKAYTLQSDKIAYSEKSNNSKKDLNSKTLEKINLYTIGFTKTTAENFFKRIKSANVKRVIDVRLNNNSQLAGFAKKNDLKYFLKALGNIEYKHIPLLAPTKEILDEYKKKKGAWSNYEKEFNKLMNDRKIEKEIKPELLHQSCLLCSEDEPHHCHRRLIAEYLKNRWNVNIEINHL